MRTTLAIDDDVLAAARSLTERQRKSVGQVLSDLARQALGQPQASSGWVVRNSIRLLPVQPGAASAELGLVNQLRDESP